MADTPTLEALRQYTDEQVKAAIDAWFTEDGSQADSVNWEKRMRAALAAADAALSVQAEPVAWRFAGSYWTRYESIHEALRKQVEPLYATPQPPAPVPAVPLTEEQIGDLIPFTNRQHSGVNAWGLADMVWFARAIERAHNITGGSNG